MTPVHAAATPDHRSRRLQSSGMQGQVRKHSETFVLDGQGQKPEPHATGSLGSSVLCLSTTRRKMAVSCREGNRAFHLHHSWSGTQLILLAEHLSCTSLACFRTEHFGSERACSPECSHLRLQRQTINSEKKRKEKKMNSHRALGRKCFTVEVMCACVEVRGHCHVRSSNEMQTARVPSQGWLRYWETTIQR